MYKAGDMICNHATTIANGQIIASGGQVTINATMNGQQVFANVYGIGFPHHNASGTTMSLFYGGTNNADSVVTWTQSDTTNPGNIANGTRGDSAHFHYPYDPIFNFDTCNNFVSVNCDCFWYNDSSKTSVSVILPDTSFNASNTEVFIVLKNVSAWGSIADTTTAVLSSVGSNWGSTHYNAATNTLNMLSERQTDIVPAGLPYTLVVITNKNGTYYFWQTSGTIPHNGIVATAALATDTQTDIVARLQGL
jgi:hypothetical protein